MERSVKIFLKNDTWGSQLKFLFLLCCCEIGMFPLHMYLMNPLCDIRLLPVVPLLYLCLGWLSHGCFLIGWIKCLGTKCSCEFQSSYNTVPLWTWIIDLHLTALWCQSPKGWIWSEVSSVYTHLLFAWKSHVLHHTTVE